MWKMFVINALFSSTITSSFPVNYQHANITVKHVFNHPILLLNILFNAPMGRFQLELIYCLPLFSTVVPSNICMFLSCRPFVVNTTFSTGRQTEVTSTPTRPVENVVLTTKGLHERNIQLLDGTTVKIR